MSGSTLALVCAIALLACAGVALARKAAPVAIALCACACLAAGVMWQALSHGAGDEVAIIFAWLCYGVAPVLFGLAPVAAAETVSQASTRDLQTAHLFRIPAAAPAAAGAD